MIVVDKLNIVGDPLPGFMVRYRLCLVILAHTGLFALALLAAFLLAFNFQHFDEWFGTFFIPLLLVALPIKVLTFQWAGQYRGSWRYVGLRDLYSVISVSLVGTFLFLCAYFLVETLSPWLVGHILIDPERHLPQSTVFLSDWAATVVFVSAARILIRFYYEDIQPQRAANPTRVLIVGAGDTGEVLLREILRAPGERYHCVGILDDEAAQLHGRIHEVPIVGRTHDLRRICEERQVQEVLIALRQAPPKMIREFVEQCEGLGVHFRTIPAIADVIEGRVTVSQIRDVDIADLLGRDPVELDLDKIGKQLQGRPALVTGAGGSIGSEMCRQIASFDPKRLVLVEQAENALFEIEQELIAAFPGLDVVPYVADVTDRNRVRTILKDERPHTVFHAAAHKHVPMMEINPGEAIKNNVGGTMTIADASIEYGVEKVVLISTDKAVNPTSVMGCSKRVAELYIQGLSKSSGTQFVTVRFGNVLGSSGSVVPIFRRQIAAGGPVTVTDAEMVRFFMTIPEASQLVLQAGTMGRGGEIYVLNMGDPVKILDLAKDMITLSGLRPGVDIEIKISGRRPGEKLYEELSSEGEHIGSTSHPKIGIWKHSNADSTVLRAGIEKLMATPDTASPEELRSMLKALAPEYTPDNGNGGTTGEPNEPSGSVVHQPLQ